MLAKPRSFLQNQTPRIRTGMNMEEGAWVCSPGPVNCFAPFICLGEKFISNFFENLEGHSV